MLSSSSSSRSRAVSSACSSVVVRFGKRFTTARGSPRVSRRRRGFLAPCGGEARGIVEQCAVSELLVRQLPPHWTERLLRPSLGEARIDLGDGALDAGAVPDDFAQLMTPPGRAVSIPPVRRCLARGIVSAQGRRHSATRRFPKRRVTQPARGARIRSLPGGEKSRRVFLRFGTRARSYRSHLRWQTPCVRRVAEPPTARRRSERGGTDEQGIRGSGEGP